MSLVIFLKRKKWLKEKCRKLIKPLSHMALRGKEMNKPTSINRVGRTYVKKRKYFGDKNKELNG